MIKLDSFERAYLVAALWSSTDDQGEPLDSNYSIEDLSDETILKAKEDCKRFRIKAESFLDGLDDEQCGHGFWLTRNRHGCGYWDRGYPKRTGETLTKMAHSFGKVYLYVGDDGKVYQL